MTDRYLLGEHHDSVSAMLARLDAAAVPARLKAGDHTLWSDRPDEIADRLAWLTLPESMADAAQSLPRFGQEMRAAGYRHIVLLGMGGSSLGPEVIRQTFGSRAGYPQMITLDSTLPAWVTGAAAGLDPARTLFVVSSKSGTTTEPLAFYAYFRHLVDAAVAGGDDGNGGSAAGGANFIAVTDPDTPLAHMAQADGFRRAFLNDPEIGGRYSALSHFGLAPAALIGVDLPRLLAPAAAMQQQCLASGPAVGNPGARLGAAIGALAQQGRDKLTLVASPGIAGFGLWAEQLLAESTGKNGRGIIPVAAEPLADPEAYGADRFFVHLRLAGDDHAAANVALSDLHHAGHPVAVQELPDIYHLGAEFYRWEYATAVAGHILGIHPFDQPDVQDAKDRTVSALDGYRSAGRLPPPPAGNAAALQALLDDSKPGDYLAILAYLPETGALEDALRELRRRVMRRYRIATTAGYGPRYLHSTGQLHKGGPASGIFLQLTQAHAGDIDIPRWPFRFGILADAQAQGDLQALQELGRRTVAIHLGDKDPAAAVRSLTAALFAGQGA